MAITIAIALLLFAALSFSGAGIAYGMVRAREQMVEERDVGTRSVAALLLVFGAVCAFLAVGVSGVVAFGGVIVWASYVLTAQRVGVFQIEQWRPQADSYATRGPIA